MSRLRSLAWELIRLPSRIAFRRTLARKKLTPPAGEPSLSYGGALRRKPGGIIAGGRVKLLHLERVWPEREHFNLLYLVSSAPVPHALDFARWAKSRGAKLVWNQNGVAFPAWAGDRCQDINHPMAEMLRLADFVVYQSDFCRVSADRFLGTAQCPAAVCLNPVDLASFAPAPEPPAPDCWRLLTAGTHYQPWRVLEPLETLCRLRDAGQPAHLTIAGALRWPHAEAQVREAIVRQNLAAAVSLRPAFNQQEAAALYRGAHVLLHPKYHDPCPTVVIEALACGLPVVGSRSGGLPELVGEDGGELIEVPLSWDVPSAPDPLQMTEAVARIMQAWPARSRAARARAVRLFDAGAWVEAHRRIFTDITA